MKNKKRELRVRQLCVPSSPLSFLSLISLLWYKFTVKMNCTSWLLKVGKFLMALAIHLFLQQLEWLLLCFAKKEWMFLMSPNKSGQRYSLYLCSFFPFFFWDSYWWASWLSVFTLFLVIPILINFLDFYQWDKDLKRMTISVSMLF